MCQSVLSIDTETTGLRAYHGDQIFSVIISNGKKTFYFNFNDAEDIPHENRLKRSHLEFLRDLFEDPERLWFAHNFKFDLHMLGMWGFNIYGKLHCTQANKRVTYNDYFFGKAASLDSALAEIGEKKDDAVKEYIKKHKLFTKVGKKKYLHFDKVPFSIIVPYAEQDALGCFKLGLHQISEIKKQDLEQPQTAPRRSVKNVLDNERQLTKTIYNIESRGAKVDIDYCRRARLFEDERGRKAALLFQRETGRKYEASPKLFAEVFNDQKERWSYTAKGAPSFDADAIKKFSGPIAGHMLTMRDAKSKCDFYDGFLYHADAKGFIHPTYNPDGSRHGRFSSSNPNLQNLTNEEDVDPSEEFLVRRAFIPPSDEFIIDSFDYSAMEYRFMLEQACRMLGYLTKLSSMVKDGHDVHGATAQLALPTVITRNEAKRSNFLTVYGGGAQRLADDLKCSLDKAQAIRSAIFTGAPEIKTYIESVIDCAKTRGYIINWLGRRCYFPIKSKCYKAPNYHTSGGCADVVKVVMNKVEDYLEPFRSKLILQVHDELIFYTHKDEAHIVRPKIKELMENTYEAKYLPLTVGHSYSTKSLGDLIES